MPDAALIAAVRNKYQALRPVLDEKVRRRWAACEAMAIGWGGIPAVAAATGLSRPTMRAGLAEVRGGASDAAEAPEAERQRLRQGGGGRRRVTASAPGLRKAWPALLEASTRGAPQSPLLWTSKSTRHLAEALAQQGHQVSHHSVARLLAALPDRRQANRQTQEGRAHPDRHTPFEQINKHVQALQKRGQPVVSVDAKKKALIGACKNAGRDWPPQGPPVKVRSQDVVDQHLGKGIPYGVYDITANTGGVRVGMDHDTAQCASESLRRGWQQRGSRVYPQAKDLLVTADAGGRNG
jgi:DDE family transposase